MVNKMYEIAISDKIIKYFWYFNKVIIYGLG